MLLAARVVIIASIMMAMLQACRSEASRSTIVGEEYLSDTTNSGAIRSALTVEAEKVDSLFDDFLLQYSADSSMQFERTLFPLSYTDTVGMVREISDEEYELDMFFASDKMFTVILNSADEFELCTQTNIDEAMFERICVDSGIVEQYYFRRNAHKAWYLDSITVEDIMDNANGDFIMFYDRFSTDQEYRRRHIRSQVSFITNATEDGDGFNTESFTITPEQWEAWNVELPVHDFTNIVYGARSADGGNAGDANAQHKILCTKTPDGAVFRAVYFGKDRRGEWQLYQYEDTNY